MIPEIEYTKKEVAQHTNVDDVWMIIHGEVYDVTKYLMDHPGGIEALLDAAGTDASELFDNAGHSDDAFDLMVPLKIGRLKGYIGKKLQPTLVMAPPVKKIDSVKHHRNLGSLPLSFFSLGLVAISYRILRGDSGLIAILSKLPQLSRLQPFVSTILMRTDTLSSGSPAFLKGLLAGSSILIGCVALATRTLLNAMMPNTSFRKYPAHIKLPKPLEQDLLLRRGWLGPSSSPLPLTKKKLIAPNVYRLTFSLPDPKMVLGLPTGQHAAIIADIDGEKITRSYTPVSNNLDLGILELVVKIYPDGKLTGAYFANLQEGDEVHFRGPKGAMRYSRGLCKEIGMLAGGTGITPMFQLIRAICENDRDTTKISLIYANQTEADILLKKELDNFSRRYPDFFKVFYVVEHPSSNWQSGVGYVTKDMMKQRFPAPNADTKVMVCGPPGLVTAAKKVLGEMGYETPGASPRMSDQIFVF